MFAIAGEFPLSEESQIRRNSVVIAESDGAHVDVFRVVPLLATFDVPQIPRAVEHESVIRGGFILESSSEFRITEKSFVM
jgi:hypothetical protein